MTKKDKLQKCRNLLYKNKLSKDDKIWLINEVFKLHKNYNDKIGKGAKDIVIGNSIRGTKCFFIVRKDNTVIDISFHQCLKPSTKKTDVNKVLRNIVDYQIKDFRIKNNIPYNYDVDHYDLEFKDIVRFFMVGKDYDEIHKKIIDKDDFTQTFKDDDLVKEFQCLHKSLAKLQGLPKEEHKKKTYKWN